MIDGWLFFSLIASLLFAVTELFDKFFVDREIEDYIFGGIIYALPLVIVMTILGFVKSSLIYHFQSILFGSIAGGLYFTVLVLYLKGISQEDVSRFIPTLSLNTVFIAVISVFLLGESLGYFIYTGILMTVTGAFLISLENPLSSLKEFQSGKAVFLALGIAALQAIRDILIKTSSNNVEIWTIVLWMGIGGTFISFLNLIMFRKDRVGEIKDHKRFIGVGGIRSLGYLSFMIAISLGSVTMASAVLKTNGMFVFFGATILSISDRMLNESKERKVILQKFLASGIIVSGVIILELFSA